MIHLETWYKQSTFHFNVYQLDKEKIYITYQYFVKSRSYCVQFSLVGFNDAFFTLLHTIRLYKRSGKGVYKQMSCQGITRLNMLPIQIVNTNYIDTQETKKRGSYCVDIWEFSFFGVYTVVFQFNSNLLYNINNILVITNNIQLVLSS